MLAKDPFPQLVEPVFVSIFAFFFSCIFFSQKVAPIPPVFQQIASRVIVPNICLRQFDIEQFFDSPREYIALDLESADAGTRRRAAMDLVRAISKLHESEITKLLMSFVSSELQSNPMGQSWESKDACIYIVTAVAAKTATKAAGEF